MSPREDVWAASFLCLPFLDQRRGKQIGALCGFSLWADSVARAISLSRIDALVMHCFAVVPTSQSGISRASGLSYGPNCLRQESERLPRDAPSFRRDGGIEALDTVAILSNS